MISLWHDVRFGLRQLARNPIFALVAILTLALGIGANTAIFSVADAVLLRFLPVPNPQQIVFLHTSDFVTGGQTGYGDTSLTEPVYEALRKENSVFTDLVAFVPAGIPKVAVRYASEPEEAAVDYVSGNFFSGLEVKPALGRGFTMDDETTHAPVAVVSYDYWTSRLGRDPNVIGHALAIKGVPFTIVGVSAPGFVGLEPSSAVEIWAPFQTRADLKPWGHAAEDKTAAMYGIPHWWFLLEAGRLRPSVTQKQALAELNPIFARTALEGATADELKRKPPALTFSTGRGIQGLKDDYQQPLLVLMAMVGLVLVIACGNVAMLLVARNAARQREFSLRMALGGNRLRLFRQLLTESLLLVAGGAVLGWIFATWATESLASWSQIDLSLSPDKTVLFFTLGVSILAALVFGLAPLRSVVKIPIGVALKTSSATAHQDVQKHRSAQIVIGLQVSLCLVLLVSAGLLVRTLRNLEHMNLGMRASGLLVFGVNPVQYVHTPEEVARFHQSLLERFRALPGVVSATLMSNRIGGGWSNNTGAYVDGKRPTNDSFSPMRWNPVGSGYFTTLQIPLIDGRDFNDGDNTNSPKVVIINKMFADRYLPKQNPLGHHVAFSNRPDAPQYTVVGVATDSKYTAVRENDRPMAYFPYDQSSNVSTMHYELRTPGSPSALLPEVRSVLREIAPDVPLMEPMTQQEQFAESISQEGLIARLSMFFGLLAAVLVATGLYGTLAYRVSRRTAEIGIRMALGAQRNQVLWMILRESLRVSLLGIAVGLPVAVGCAQLLRSLLYGLGPNDPLTFVLALTGMLLVVVGASLIPARQAASVDPIVALRNE